MVFDSSHNYIFDAENRIVQVDNGVQYIYDAEGRRVGKPDGTVYVVTASGDVLDEFRGSSWVRSEISLGSHHIATLTK